MLRFQLDTTGNLLKDLIAWWPLDEPGGQRRDMLGYNPLTDNATVTSAKGIGGQGTSAKFTAANSEYLSIADNPVLSTGNIDWTLAAWVYLDSKSAARVIAEKGWDIASQKEYILTYSSGDDKFKAEWSSDGTAVTSLLADTFGSPSAGTWYFVVLYHDGTANQIGISINAGTADTTGATGGIDGTAAFLIGATPPVDPNTFMDGRIQYVGFWKRVLSQQERTDLYNFGRGNRLITY